MLRSLYSAVSGVKAHQTYLDVTGNNIANVNTVGFKRDMINFKDMIYQTMQGASAPDNGVPIGGVNPMQVGLGVKVGSIETIHTQGSPQSTGNRTDMAIQGEGFFVVRNGGQTFYTRAGNFVLDRDGNLAQSGSGNLVQGYAYKEVTDPVTGVSRFERNTELSSINIPLGRKMPAKATDLIGFRCNLCSTTTPAIASLDKIPGGASKVLRPHEYTAYGAMKTDYVGATAPGTPLPNQTWYDTAGDMLKKWNNTTLAWEDVRQAAPEDMFFGANTDPAATFPTVFQTGDGLTGNVVNSRRFVDNSGAAAPGALPTKAGETYLNTATGELYTANLLGNAWGTPVAIDQTTAYADKTSGNVFLYNSTAATMTNLGAAATLMDTAGGANQLFQWNGAGTTRAWTNITADGLSPSGVLDPGTGLPVTTTDQATIDAFGESMIKKHDHAAKTTIYDSLGNAYTVETVFRKVLERPADPNANPPVAAESEWDWYSYYVDGEGKPLEQYGEGAGTLVFGDDGLLKRTYFFEATPATPTTNATSNSQPTYNWQLVEKIVDQNDPRYNATIHDSLPTGKIVADFNVSGAEGSVIPGDPLTYKSNMINLDFLGQQMAAELGQNKEPIDGVTQYGSSTTTKGYYQNGYAMGELNDFSVGGDGTITGIYSNGKNLPIAVLALATFANPQGLTKMGDTVFSESINSGMAQIGVPGQGGAGSIMGSTLEMSNVDLSEEFVNLIRAQRGFQANTRVVTTSDQVLEELINMKR